MIANVFNQMGLIEAWGTGIRRIKETAKSYGLPSPEILVFDDMFRVNLYRNQMSEGQNGHVLEEASEKHRKLFREDLNDTQIRILELLSVDERLSAVKIGRQLGIASRNVEANIKKLKEQGILIRHGSPKSGYWEIINNKNS